MGKEIKWNFNYKGKSFENQLKESFHGDFYFVQNEDSLFMSQCGERYFLSMLIYGMQKIKSPEEAKKDLEKKDWIRGLDFEVSHSNGGAYQYFSLIFTILNKFDEFKVREHSVREKIVKIDKELKVFYNNQETIILPYNQLSLTIDKLLLASEDAWFRTNKEDYSKMIGYYVSGEFEKYHKRINKLSTPSI